MRVLHRLHTLFLGLALSALAAGAAASPQAPANGREYQLLEQAQPTDAGQKIEVTEFFAYSCPHCNVFEPALAAWVKKNQDRVVFKRVHVAFRQPDPLLQRLHVTLQAMGVAEQYSASLFDAIHVQRERFKDEEAMLAWADKAGLARRALMDTFTSFGVDSKVRNAQSMVAAYKVNQWPMIAIDGRFMTSPYQVASAANPPLNEADGQQGALKVMDFLVTKALAEKK